MVWPASMLANRRTERLIGLVRKEMISIGTSSSSKRIGACGTKSFRKPMPCLTKPVMMTARMTTAASANVTQIWLVTVKDHGTSPKKLANKTNMKIVKTKGKKIRPSSPAAELIMLATNSDESSAMDWALDGTRERRDMAIGRNSETAATTMTMRSDWFVKEAS